MREVGEEGEGKGQEERGGEGGGEGKGGERVIGYGVKALCLQGKAVFFFFNIFNAVGN